MQKIIADLAGWIPAVILPLAALLQLIKIIKTKSGDGVSVPAWTLFGIANIGLYIFTEKYFALQSLAGLLGTAVIDFMIVGLVLWYKK